jgi:plastocyanin
MSVMAGALAFCFLLCASPSRSAEPRVYIIEIDKLAFAPAPEGLRVNDIVEWTNVDIFRHTASATDGSFDSDLRAGATGQTSLRRTGVVTYICRFHPGMNGRLDVAP